MTKICSPQVKNFASFHTSFQSKQISCYKFCKSGKWKIRDMLSHGCECDTSHWYLRLMRCYCSCYTSEGPIAFTFGSPLRSMTPALTHRITFDCWQNLKSFEDGNLLDEAPWRGHVQLDGEESLLLVSVYIFQEEDHMTLTLLCKTKTFSHQ